MLLVSLEKAGEGGCVIKESLSSLSRTLYQQTTPLLIIISNLEDNMEAFDYYFYPPTEDILSPVTLVKGQVFQNLSSAFLQNPNSTLLATSQTNPFAEFYHSRYFLFYRIFWIVLYVLIIGGPLLPLYLIFKEKQEPKMRLKLGCLVLCILLCLSRIIFYSLGGDYTSLFKRIIYEFGYIYTCGSISLLCLIWVGVLQFHSRVNLRLLLAGKGLTGFFVLVAGLSYLFRILAFVTPGTWGNQAFTVTVVVFLVLLFFYFLFMFLTFLYVRRLLAHARDLSDFHQALFRHYNVLALFQLCMIIGSTFAFLVAYILNKKTLVNFNLRIWSYEIISFAAVIFYSIALLPMRKKTFSTDTTAMRTIETPVERRNVQ